MKLYNSDIQSNPRRVRIFLEEKGLDVDTENIDIFAGEQFTPDFKAKSPIWDIPLLELDNGIYISQVNAICRYLEDLYPESPLYGTEILEKAQIEMWNHIAFINGMQAIAEVARNGMEIFKDRAVLGTHPFEQIPELATRGQERMRLFMQEMNRRLSDNTYIAGEKYSVADITTFVAVDLAINNGIEMPGNCQNFDRWYQEMLQRPSSRA